MKNPGDLTRIRQQYQAQSFDEQSLDPLPHRQFQRWFEQYRQLDAAHVTAMVLSTASSDGTPSARVVLLKHYDAKGFCWYSDYRSQKGRQLSLNPQAELLFYWPELDRQVRIFGPVEQLDRDQARYYFAARPRGSQLSAAASCQSQVVSDRAQLERQAEVLAKQWLNQPIPCPESWGGYRLIPLRFEFWQGREDRLHDRLVYRDQRGRWRVERLSP